jgi:hypothetical protein
MTEQSDFQRLLMRRDQLDRMRIEVNDAVPEPAADEIVLRLDRFALTTNNITYAAFGEAMKYWDFFPVEGADWGQMPVWGYADVVASTVPEIAIGQRYFGYFPTATHLCVRPGKINQASFRDDMAHRRALPDIYNWYQRTDQDAFHAAETEPLHAIYRPLFITAFSLADFLHDNAGFGARRLLISSASSKTAYATAWCLRQLGDMELLGLTSDRNLKFVAETGLYDQALSYTDLERVDRTTPTLYVDVAGNPDLTCTVHETLGDKLVYDCTVGSAQSPRPSAAPDDLPGPRPRFFFAPDHIARRHQDWGVAEFNRRAGQATLGFYQYVTRPQQPLLTITHIDGLEGAEKVIAAMLAGQVDPREGHLVHILFGTHS